MIGLCERFRCLPWPGSLMDQPAGLVRMLDVYRLGHREEEDAEELREVRDG